MSEMNNDLKKEILRLYTEPALGSSSLNSYGEENIKNLVNKYRELNEEEMRQMGEMVATFSTSGDLMSSFVSVAVLHALGMKGSVDEAYEWAKNREDESSFTSHFDIGISLAEHFFNPPKGS